MHGKTAYRRLTYLCLAGFVCNVAPPTFAQEPTEEGIEEIVVVGTRRLDRTVANSPVPVDVFQGSEFQNMGTGDMDDMMRTLVPSYNVKRFALDDEASLVRPATLRGLPTQHTLVLVNGKRRHRSAVIAVGSFGQQGPDLSVLPAIGLQRAEILRDGASAQYGSDAMAGVINFIMRDNRDGLIAEYKTGQFYAGDGDTNQFGINAGLPLTDKGFINLSLEYGDRETTSRSEQRFDARALEDLGAQGIPNPAQNYGQPSIDNEVKFFANAAIEIGKNSEIYAFGNYAERDVELEFFWRNPNDESGIFVDWPNRLVFDLTSDGSGNCPVASSPNAIPVPDFFFPTQAEYDADLIALAALEADPDCWVVNEIYPGGYRPDYGAGISDRSTVLGFRGERNNGFRYDLSASYGTSDARYTLSNSINASMGPASPTSFRPGDSLQSETSMNFDLAWPVDVGPFYSPLNIAAGFEWHEESFEIVAGDEASWTVGPLQTQGARIGSHGYAGYSPQQAGTWDRANTAIYLDLEADITKKLLLGLAVRYEDFDDFGSTTNYKGSFRYSFTDIFAIRASLSTGFRAPTPGQSNLTRLGTFSSQGQLTQVGLIPPTNPVAEFYGGKALQPEESDNFSAGFSLEPLDNLTLTADFFRIDLEDGIDFGRSFVLTPEDIAELIALGVPGASDFEEIFFFGNNTGLRIEGFDVVASYNIDWRAAGNTDVSLAWNYIKKKFVASPNLNRFGVVGEEGEPKNRAILTLNHSWNDFRFLIRTSYYDGWVVADFDNGPFLPVCTDERPNPPGTDHCYGDTWMVDIEAAYTFKDRYSIIVGADNVFDEFPETHFLFPDFSFGEKYPASSPIGYHGGFWYVRLSAEF
jgi:iron complex outermembrane receptor protein